MRLPLSLLIILGSCLYGATAILFAQEQVQPHAKEVPPPQVLPPLYSKGLSVAVNTSTAPECAAWAQQAKTMVELWFPVVAAYLDTPGWKAPPQITLEFVEMKGVAHASGSTITISRKWIADHPQDIGMVLHEMVHVIQAYPPQKDHWWLTEGIADYIRFWLCEPSGQPRINRSTDHYRKGYRVTGAFLAWVEKSQDPLIIRKCHAALRAGSYTDALFKESTGKDLDALWQEFMSSLEAASK